MMVGSACKHTVQKATNGPVHMLLVQSNGSLFIHTPSSIFHDDNDNNINGIVMNSRGQC